MPSYRIGFGSDFILNGQRVGVGSTDPTVTLDVRGTIKGDFNVSGATTLTSYAGFVPQKQFVNENLTLTGDYNTVSEDIIVGLGKTFTISAGSSVSIGTLKNVSIGTHFSVPNGGTSARTDSPVEGMVRFNDDLNTLEFWNGYEWRQFNVTGASGRGVFGGGATTTGTQVDYITISSTGNALDFGVLNEKTEYMGSCSSSIRGLFGGGRNPASINSIQYLTIASTGNAQDFGDLTVARLSVGACASSTRGVFASGEPAPYFNVIDYVQISTIGNALDFGDLTSSRAPSNGLSSSTRGIFAGGFPNSTTIDSITISSTGNAIKFGDLSVAGEVYCSSNSIRGIFFHPQGSISYITISSFGNSIDFGNYTVARFNASSCSSSTRGIFAGGRTPTIQNVIDYVTMASTGNAQDFGDLTFARHALAACSDSHGGLGGF